MTVSPVPNMPSALLWVTLFASCMLPYTYAQGGTGAGVACARECVSLYFSTDIGANCTDLAGKTQDLECACEENNFRTAFPCCLEQTCSEDEWDNMHLRGVDYGALCGREPGSNMEIKLGECESKELYYNPSASGFAGSTSSVESTSTASAVSSASNTETSPSTTGESQATNPADTSSQDTTSSSSNGGGNNTSLGLGVGLGVGIPLLIVGMSIVYFLFWRTKRKDKPPPSEESGNTDGSTDFRESTIVGSDDWSKSRPISELPVSPSLGSPYAPSELPSNWGRDSMVAHELPADDRRRSGFS